MKKGFKLQAAIAKIKEEYADTIEEEKEENRIIRGFAYTNHARSYLNYAQ